ncbi:MAG: inverse autotransporter beta domain-containing protein, partial [Verrucomicrobiota bacterium]
MHLFSPLIGLLAITLSLPSVLGAGEVELTQPAPKNPTWGPYFELEGRAGNPQSLGKTTLFLPLWQDDSSLFFADFRGIWTDSQALEGNWGLAYRSILPNEWIWGSYLFYDVRRTDLNNTFHQATIGTEFLNEEWAFRFNGYLPEQKLKTVDGTARALLENRNIVVRRDIEAAFAGFDLEAERLLWSNHGGGPGKNPITHLLHAEFWLAAALFHFGNDDSGLPSMTGPRFGAELRLFDLPLLGNDSRFVMSGEYQYDDVRDSVASGTVALRIPLGKKSTRSTAPLRGLERRMVTPIVRDIDIVTRVGEVSEPARLVHTGEVITAADVIDANTSDPSGVISALGANSVAVADGSQGTITANRSFILSDGQVLMGGGSQLAVTGANSGTPATFTGPGTRPTINYTDITPGTGIVVLTNNNTLLGIDLTGGRNGVYTNGLDVSNILIDDVQVSGADDDGFDLEAFTGTFQNSRALNNGDDGFDFDGDINGLVTNNVATGNADHGFSFFDIASLGEVTNNTANANAGDGFNFEDVENGGVFSSNTASSNTGDGFNFFDVESGGIVANNTAT